MQLAHQLARWRRGSRSALVGVDGGGAAQGEQAHGGADAIGAPRRPAAARRGDPAALAQLLDLRGREPARGALRRGRRGAAGRRRSRSSSLDRVADRLAHPPDLALAALVDRRARAGRARAARTRAGAVRPSSSSTPSRSARSARSRTGGRATCRAVGLRDLEARVREAVGELAVVGEQDQAGGVGVEAADRVEPRRASVDEVDDGAAAVRVLGGGDDARPACSARRRRARSGAGRPARRRTRRRSCSSTSRAGSVTTSPPTVTRPARTSSSARGARRRRRGRGTWRGASRCLPYARMDLELLDSRRWPTPASPPSAPARCGPGPRAARPATRR